MSTTIATTRNPIPRMLAEARRELLVARDRLAAHRRLKIGSTLLWSVETEFLAALDRVWDVQCMTVASF